MTKENENDFAAGFADSQRDVEAQPALDAEQGDRCRDCGSSEEGNCFYCKAD